MRPQEEAYLDRALLASSLDARMNGIPGAQVETYRLELKTEMFGVTIDQLVAHAKKRGMIVKDNIQPLSITLGEHAAVKAKLVNEIKKKSKMGVIPYEDVEEITKRYNIYEHDLESILLYEKIAYINYKREIVGKEARKRIRLESAKREAEYSTTSPRAPADNQYGVLQGAANAAGGCATMWGVAFLILSIVLLFLLIKMIFTGE